MPENPKQFPHSTNESDNSDAYQLLLRLVAREIARRWVRQQTPDDHTASQAKQNVGARESPDAPK